MKVKVIENGTVYENQEPFGYSAWPTCTLLKDGSIAVVFSGNRLWHVCPFGRVYLTVSKDGVKTWTKPKTVINTVLDDRDGGICVFGKNRDKIFVSSFTNTPELQTCLIKDMKQELSAVNDSYYEYLFSKYDKNEICDKYLGGTHVISYDNGETFEDFGILPIHAPHGPCVGVNGELIFVGKSLQDKSKYGEFGALDKGFYMLTSADGKKWEIKSKVVDGEIPGYACMSEAHPIVLKSGRILVQIRYNGKDKHGIYQTYSDDGGKTFGELKFVIEKGFPPHLTLLKNGDLLSTYGYRFDDMGLRARISKDEGETWSEEIIIKDDAKNADLGYPTTVELNDGTFLTVYYMIREGMKNAGIYYIKWKM